MKICVYGAASSLIDNSYIEAGKELGRKIVERGHGLVFGGGSHGMMGAVVDGVAEKSGYSLGIIPEFFKEAGAEISADNCTDYIYTETMRERKRELEENSNAFIVTLVFPLYKIMLLKICCAEKRESSARMLA